MNLRQLDHFLAVVRAGSLTAAAQELNVAQPTLTKTIQSLEQELGVKLFERLSRGVALTQAGQILKRHAERVGVQMTDAIDELRSLEGGVQGPIAIGAGPSWLRRTLPGAVAAMVRTHGSAKVTVHGGFDDFLLKALRAGELDFVVAELPQAENARDLSLTALSSDQLGVCCRVGHPLTEARQTLTAAATLAYPWVMPPRSTRAQQRLVALFVGRDLPPPQIVVESESMSFLLHYVKQSEALTFTVSSTVELPEADCTVMIEVPELQANRAAGVITRRDGWLSPACRLIIAELTARSALKPKM